MALLKRLQQTQSVMLSMRHMLPSVPEGEEAVSACEVTHSAIEQFISNTHSEWFSTIEASISRHLQANLLVQDKGAGGGSDGCALYTAIWDLQLTSSSLVA